MKPFWHLTSLPHSYLDRQLPHTKGVTRRTGISTIQLMDQGRIHGGIVTILDVHGNVGRSKRLTAPPQFGTCLYTPRALATGPFGDNAFFSEGKEGEGRSEPF
jgi:hypothetical protein